jgi:hypothetical protein
MTTPRRSLLAVILLSIIGIVTLSSRGAAAQPAHLVWAEDLLDNLSPALNTYEGGSTYITWAGVDGAAEYSNHTMCNSFVTNLLRNAYDLTESDVKAWLGAKSPLAAQYHDQIALQNGFDLIPTVDAIEGGDIIAIRYPEGGSVSGHVMVAEGPAVARAASSPIVAGTFQFEVPVMDSSSSGHGALDTRRQADGTYQRGAGAGTMRIYTDGDLNIVGYTWSTYSSSSYRAQSSYHLVVGRLQ